MEAAAFDNLTDVYEAMIDWPRRLAHEEPFYRRWFSQAQVQSVLDVACGTGYHAALFAHWGLRVLGRDCSAQMIERAKERHGVSPTLQWSVRSFEEADPGRPFDAAICVGNSLALAADMASAERAVCHMLASVRAGGLAIVHVLNLWHLADGPCVWQKCLPIRLADNEALVLKGVHRNGDRGMVELVVLPQRNPTQYRAESVPFLGIQHTSLAKWADSGGASDSAFFGDYRETAYDRGKSTDLIMVARKGP